MRSGNILRTLKLSFSLGLMVSGAVALAQNTAPDEDSGMSAFGKMIPLGFLNRDVRVPSFDEGKPSSLLTAATLVRLDQERLSAEKVVVEIYGKTLEENLRVDLKSAVYHMGDQVLRSGERSRVSRTDFEMEGDSMVFDAASSIGGMKGRVRTLIFDTGALSGKSKDNQPSN